MHSVGKVMIIGTQNVAPGTSAKCLRKLGKLGTSEAFARIGIAFRQINTNAWGAAAGRPLGPRLESLGCAPDFASSIMAMTRAGV
jgi:hypothetical protein